MSSPYAEGGPLPPVDRDRLAEHEQRLADWKREIEEKRDEDAVLQRLRDGLDEL